MIFWYWLIIALVLLVGEVLTAGFFFLWMAFAAALTGILAWLFAEIGLESQVFFMAATSIGSIFLWRKLNLHYPISSDHPLLNQRGRQYVGRVFSLYEPIVNGQGKIKVDDSLWKVQGEDCPSTEKVKIVAVQGTVFIVERVT